MYPLSTAPIMVKQSCADTNANPRRNCLALFVQRLPVHNCVWASYFINSSVVITGLVMEKHHHHHSLLSGLSTVLQCSFSCVLTTMCLMFQFGKVQIRGGSVIGTSCSLVKGNRTASQMVGKQYIFSLALKQPGALAQRALLLRRPHGSGYLQISATLTLSLTPPPSHPKC